MDYRASIPDPEFSTPDLTSTMRPEDGPFWEQRAGDQLYSYASLIIVIIGTIGNILSLLVFNKKSMRLSVTSVYFRVLAVSDTVVLYSATLLFWILGTFHYDVTSASTSSCKFFIPALLISCYFSCWILVFISVDRFIGVFLPHKYKQYCTQFRAAVTMMVLFVTVFFTVGVYNMTALDIQHNSVTNTTMCGISPKYQWFHGNVYVWLDLCILNLIPTVVLIAMNMAIIGKLSKAAMTRLSVAGTPGKKHPGMNSTNAILISVSVVYFLCTIPSSTAFLVQKALGSSPRGQAKMMLYQRVCLTLFSINHAVNFFLYCLHGKKFRKELYLMFLSAKNVTLRSTQSTHSTELSEYRRSQLSRKASAATKT